MEGFKTKIIALFLGFTVCASAQQFSGVADISSVTSAGGSNYTVNVYSFNGGYLLGGSTQYTALSIQAGDLMWWNCDTFRIVSTSGGNPDGIAFTISVGGGQGTPSPNSRVAFVRETEDQTQPLPYIGFNSPFGLSSDVWQCIQAYYAEHYRRIWKDSTSAAEYNKVQFSKDSVFSRIVDSDKTTQIWQDADSIALRKSKSGYASWIHVVTDSVTTQVNGNPFRVTGDSVSLGRKPANYLFNVGALLSEYSATPKSYVDSLVAASGGGGGSVSSVFGRTGAVTAASGDYTAAQVTNTPAGNIAATTVQAALNELDTEKLSSETDGSVTNEGALSVGAGGASSSTIVSNTSGATAVTLNASTGLSISENTGTGNITLTNSAPDQTVTLTGAGITAISGTYPTFTVTSTEVDGSTTNEIELPSQTGNSGKYLTTNGSTPSWGTVSGGTPAGSTTEIQYNNAGAFDGQANITTTEGATTGNELSIAGGSVTTGKALNVTANALTTGSVVNVSSTSTAAGSNTQTGVNVSLSGANGTSSQTTYGMQVSNTHTGTSSTNVGLKVTASGGTNNYAIDAQGAFSRFSSSATVYTPYTNCQHSIQHSSTFAYGEVRSSSRQLLYGVSSTDINLSCGGGGALNVYTASSLGGTFYQRYSIKDDGGLSAQYLGGSTTSAGTATNIPGTIFSQTASSTAITNTTTETSLLGTGIGTKTLAASTLRAGTRLHVVVSGTLATDAVTPGTLNVKLKLGSTVVASTTATTLVAVTGTRNWQAEFYLTCRTSGASGVLQASGDFEFYSVAGTKQFWECSETNTTAFSTTGTLAVDVTATFGTADADNSMLSTQAIITIEGAN